MHFPLTFLGRRITSLSTNMARTTTRRGAQKWGIASPVASFSSRSTAHNITGYLNELGIKEEMHQALLASIRPVVVPHQNEEKEITVATIKAAFQDTSDLIALSQSLEQQQSKKRRLNAKKKKRQERPKQDVIVRLSSSPDSSPTATLTWRYGESLLDLFQSSPGQEVLIGGQQDPDKKIASEIMEGACGGHCSCSTCHVYLDPETFAALEPPTEAELDMLDLAFQTREKSSRLGCQVKFNHFTEEKLQSEHKIVVALPSGVNNHWES